MRTGSVSTYLFWFTRLGSEEEEDLETGSDRPAGQEDNSR